VDIRLKVIDGDDVVVTAETATLLITTNTGARHSYPLGYNTPGVKKLQVVRSKKKTT
jgi:hypothetical protein